MSAAPGAQLAGRIQKMAKAVEDARKVSVKEAADVMKDSIEHSRNAAVGSDGRMSRVGRSGAKLGVAVRMSGAEATVQASGPWPLIENNIPAHTIKPKKGRKRGVAFGGIVRASVRHPGTKGKQPWKKGRTAGVPKSVEVLRSRTTSAVYGAFKAGSS